MSNQKVTIEISSKTIFITVGILLTLGFLFYIRDILIFIFIGILIMSALNPLVKAMERRKVRRGLSIAFVYIMALTLFVLGVAAIVPPLVTQIISLITQIPIPPGIAQTLQSVQLSLQDLQVIVNQLTSVPKILEMLSSAFSGVIVFVSLIVLSLYLLIERPKFELFLRKFVPTKKNRR